MEELSEPPACFRDLNLDQVVDAITAGREEYHLKPIFYTHLADAETVVYRQEVMRDTERRDIAGCVERFAERMRRFRGHLTVIGRLECERQREVWHLAASAVYCEAVQDLAQSLQDAVPSSRGLRAIRAYLTNYVQSGAFASLAVETERLERRLGGVRYTMTIKAGSVRVNGYDGEPDYGAEIQRTFERFKQGAVQDHRVRFADLLEMGHVEAAVLEFVARLHPDLFTELGVYCETHRDYVDPVLARFDREIQFYAAYHEYVEPIKRAGPKLCYPELCDGKDELARETFDLALAAKLTKQRAEVIRNDWRLSGNERIFVISGPNQGGKTTFARTFGQLHYLASIGCPVPGAQARLLLCDQVLTHFEKQEDLSNRHGKLEDDLVRVRGILEQATGRTIVVMNESFTSTTLEDARFLGTEVLNRMIARDVLGVYVTFVDELAWLAENIVSATSCVDRRDPTIRTYKIARRAADGLAYAAVIAEKYRLTYDQLRARVVS